MNLSKEYIKNILIVKLCCLGDVVQMLPAVNALKKNLPGAKITLLADKWVLPLKDHFVDIDDVIIVGNTFSENLFSKISSAMWLVNKLIKKRFDMALIGHRNNVFGWITYLSGIRYRLGFAGTRFINFPTDFVPDINESLRYLSILKTFGINTENAEPLLQSKKNRFEILKELGLRENGKTVGLFPFGGVNPGMKMTIKRWGKQNYIGLSKKLLEKGFNVILFEGNREDETISNVNSMSGFVITKIDIDTIAACDVFIGNDTGALHIAAVFGIKSIGIFGPTDEKIFGPLNNKNNCIFLNKHIHCSPCFNTDSAMNRQDKKYWNGNEFLCHTGTHDCMETINVEVVFNTILKEL